ncbi:MAG: DNA polymerase III subunit delta' [Proteobacteria bacterium]|nr:MAG: DNA polymerase III subunit delta' [Pseudomonadota bacterium]
MKSKIMSRVKTKTKTFKDTADRPLRLWDDLIGFEGVDAKLYSLWAEGRLPQVVIVEGREGIGKKIFMAKLAARFFCETHTACGHCEGCHGVQQGYSSDMFWLETEGAIKVSEAESLQDYLQYQAQTSPRLAIIIDIETMNDQASNRLLKILEEPPAGVLVLASCSRFDKLLPTIRSRSVRWRVEPPSVTESTGLIRSRLSTAEMFSDTEILNALRMFGLSIGRTLSHLEKGSADQKAKLDRLRTLLLLPMKGESLRELQDLIKEQGFKAPDLAQFMEVALNQSYRRIMETGRETSLQDFRRIKHWRRVLSQVYRAGSSNKNNLNVQLVAEALLSPTET